MIYGTSMTYHVETKSELELKYSNTNIKDRVTNRIPDQNLPR